MIGVWIVWIGALCTAIGVLGAVGAWADLARWLKHRHYPYAPLWVNWAYRVLEWVDYKLVSPVSRRLMYWRMVPPCRSWLKCGCMGNSFGNGTI